MKRPQRSRSTPRTAPSAQQGATRRQRLSPKEWLRNQGRLHAQVLVSSLGRLYRTPLSSLMTVAVIAIALALPSGLLVILDNLQRLNASWDTSSSVSLFLKQTTGEAQAERLARELEGWPNIAGVHSIDRAHALEEFRELSGFGDALQALESNPLPHVIEIRADTTSAEDPERAMATLVDELGRLPEVELAQLDMQWLKRFAALMDIGRRGILVVGALLALAVLLIVGNTIRLDIQNRRDEIEVSKLIGATDAFIRRPFLYTGLWYGLLGALLAWILVSAGFWLVDAPVRRLAGLYESSFLLSMLSWQSVGVLLLTGIALGLAGSWVAVGRHLDAIEPS
jgi:cell division transport system permease protein